MMRANAINQLNFVRSGLIVVDADAFTAGAVPDPWADGASWLWEHSTYVVSSVINDMAQFVNVEINVKVARKLPQFRSVLMMVTENQAGSAGAILFHVALKALVLRA